LEETVVKNFICLFILISMVAFSGCATTGGTGASSSAKSTWSDADFKRMGIDKGSYGNSN